MSEVPAPKVSIAEGKQYRTVPQQHCIESTSSSTGTGGGTRVVVAAPSSRAAAHLAIHLAVPSNNWRWTGKERIPLFSQTRKLAGRLADSHLPNPTPPANALWLPPSPSPSQSQSHPQSQVPTGLTRPYLSSPAPEGNRRDRQDRCKILYPKATQSDYDPILQARKSSNRLEVGKGIFPSGGSGSPTGREPATMIPDLLS
jgi:hypothetical protein